MKTQRFISGLVWAWLRCAVLASSLAGGVVQAGTVAFWSMKNSGIDSPRVLDGELDQTVQNLWSANSAGNSFANNADVPPSGMRLRAEEGGSYDAAAITNVDGALLFPANTYGNMFNFTNAFTVQLFFKTHGDKSSNGLMQLLLQGQTSLRYGLTVNEPATGAIRFTLRDVVGGLHTVDLAARNYADGTWHYLHASYDPSRGLTGVIEITVVNQNGSHETATTFLPADFPGLRVGADGSLHLGRNTYLKSQTPRTFLGLIDEVMITEGAAGTNLVGYLPGPIARWNMNPAGGNFPAVLDSVPVDGAHHLITFNEAGNSYPTSSDVPPASLFASGYSGGPNSFNAANFAGMAGALFYPQDVYGNVFSFLSGFSIELFFKTDGNRSGDGFMELVLQGENSFRFGLIMNEPNGGNVRFALGDGQGHFPPVDLTARNYADGAWHYLMAKYVPSGGSNGLLVLTIANTNGTTDTATSAIPASFAGLPGGNDGNLFLGRNIFALNANSRNFMGLIDEVQISRGTLMASQRLGPVVAPTVTSVARSESGFTLNWSAQPGETCVVEYADALDGNPSNWTPVSVQTLTTSMATFTDTDATRLSRPQGYYRVNIQ